MDAIAQIGIGAVSGKTIQLEPLRKMDIVNLKEQTSSVVALRWLDKMKSARVGYDRYFDQAFRTLEAGRTEAIVWIIPDEFDKYHISVRVVCLRTNAPDIEFWLALIEAVHNIKSQVLSINWLLSPEQSTGQEALRRCNYEFMTRLRGQLCAPDIYCRQDAWLYRTDCLSRTDQGTSFVEFKFGWLAVSGSKKGIRSVEFIRTGSHIDDMIISFHACTLGMIAENGLVKPPSETDLTLLSSDNYQVPEPVRSAASQLEEYLEGRRTEFDVAIDLEHYSIFQKNVWTEIAQIPYAATATYDDLAAKIAKPEQRPHTLARAVGTACASNPLPVIVPCHRIIGKDGRLTGFNGGVDIKEYLLNHEVFGLN